MIDHDTTRFIRVQAFRAAAQITTVIIIAVFIVKRLID